jgi:LL-diaminopimelate aminotransferase
MKKFNDYVKTLETYVMFAIKARTTELTPMLKEKGREPISLSMGAPVDMVPQFVVERIKEYLKDPKYHTYSTPKGETYFLEAVSRRMKERFGVEMDPKSEIFSLIGSKEGIANLIRALSNPTTNEKEKDIILIPDPGYASYKEMTKVSGSLGWSVPLTEENNFMPDLEGVLDEIKAKGYDPNKVKALIINYPNNPTGALCTEEYFKKVVDFCKKHDILLISDNAYCDIYFDECDKPLSIFNIEGAKDIAVEFYSFSKPYAMTGWRLGWVCGNKDVVGVLGKLKSTVDTGIFKAIQAAGADVLNSKEGDEYIKIANAKLKKKIETFAQGLRNLGWKVEVPKATFYLWIKTPPKYSSDKEFCDTLLEKSGIVTVPGSAFGTFGKGYIRISVTDSEEKLKEVIERMEKDGHRFE